MTPAEARQHFAAVGHLYAVVRAARVEAAMRLEDRARLERDGDARREWQRFLASWRAAFGMPKP